MPAEHIVTCRPARGTDRAAIWDLVQEFAASPTPEAHSFSTIFDESVDDPTNLILVAETEQHDVVGYLLAHLRPTFHADAPVCWVEEVMVTQLLQGSGIGRSLMTGAQDWARENKAAYVSLATRRADGFYLALGYEESAVFYRRLLVQGD